MERRDKAEIIGHQVCAATVNSMVESCFKYSCATVGWMEARFIEALMQDLIPCRVTRLGTSGCVGCTIWFSYKDNSAKKACWRPETMQLAVVGGTEPDGTLTFCALHAEPHPAAAQ